MAHETDEQITPDLFLPDLLHARKSSFPSRFGVLINQICQDAGVSQNKLGQVSREIYADLIDDGHIRPGENLGSMKQSVISLVFNSKQDATPAQVYIWIEALKTFPEFAVFCKRSGYSQETLEEALWNVTDYKSPREMAAAHEFARQYIRISDPKLKEFEKTTEVEMSAISEHSSDCLHGAVYEVRKALETQA